MISLKSVKKYLSHFIRNAQNVLFRPLALWHVNGYYTKRTDQISLANGRLNRFLYHRSSQGF